MLRMSLWCDKYRPKTFKDLDYGVDQAKKLERMVNEGDFPHLLVFGPEGAGKKTRVNCILRELYGNGVEKLRLERHEFTTQSKKKIEIHSSSSNYHIEICPGKNHKLMLENGTMSNFKGSSDPSHFIFEINIGKSRIRHRTTLNLNDAIFDRF